MTGDVASAVAYRIDYVNRDGRRFVTAVYTPEAGRALVAEIEAEGGRVVEKRIERGAEAAALLHGVYLTKIKPEVF